MISGPKKVSIMNIKPSKNIKTCNFEKTLKKLTTKMTFGYAVESVVFEKIFAQLGMAVYQT